MAESCGHRCRLLMSCERAVRVDIRFASGGLARRRSGVSNSREPSGSDQRRSAHPVVSRPGSSDAEFRRRRTPGGSARPRRRGPRPARGRAGRACRSTCETCVLTVGSASTSCSAISRFDSPRATSLRTSTSRSVRSRRATLRSSLTGGSRSAYRSRRRRVTAGREERIAGGDRLDRDDEVGRRHVLEQESAGPGAQRLDDVLVGVERRQDQDVRVRRDAVADDPAGRLDAVEDRHPDVHDDDIGAEAPCRLDALLAVGRLPDHLDVGLVVEDHPEPGANELLIVDEDDPDRRRHRSDTDSAASGRRAWTRKPLAIRPASKSPSKSATRSRMPIRPRPPPPASPRSRWPDAPLVRDLDLERPRRIRQMDAGAGTGRVLERVRERLLDDPVRGEFDACVERTALAVDRQLDRQAGGADLLDELAESLRDRASARATRHRWPRARPGSRASGACPPTPRDSCGRWLRGPPWPAPAAARGPSGRPRPGSRSR